MSSTAGTPAGKEMCTFKGEKGERKILRAQQDWLTRPKDHVTHAGGPEGALCLRGRVLLNSSLSSHGRLKRTTNLTPRPGRVAEEAAATDGSGGR